MRDGKRWWRCHLCGEEFEQRAHLYKHKAKHLRDVLELCKRGGQKGSLQNVAIIRDGEKVWPCHICKEEFSNSVTVQRHKVDKHSDENTPESSEIHFYQCNYCVKKFAFPSEITNHVLTSHKEEISSTLEESLGDEEPLREEYLWWRKTEME